MVERHFENQLSFFAGEGNLLASRHTILVSRATDDGQLFVIFSASMPQNPLRRDIGKTPTETILEHLQRTRLLLTGSVE